MSKLVDMIIDAYDQGYTHDELKTMIIGTITPYFRNSAKALKYWSSNELLTAFEFLIRYYHDKEFSNGVFEVLDIYRKAFAVNKQQTYAVVSETSFDFSQREAMMWTMRKTAEASADSDSPDEVISYIKHIGEILEIGTKNLVYELWALIKIASGATPEYLKIRHLEFGTAIQNILDYQKLGSVLVTKPLAVNLAEWRNISYHQTYRVIDESNVFFIYGKKRLSFTLSFDALKQYTGQIVKSANILSIARCIFIFDYIEDSFSIGSDKISQKTALRNSLSANRLRISLLSRHFYLERIREEADRVTAKIIDLENDGSLSKEQVQERFVHAPKLMYDIWCEYQKDAVEVNFVNSLDAAQLASSVNGEVCRKIQRGEKDITYMVEYVKFEFKS